MTKPNSQPPLDSSRLSPSERAAAEALAELVDDIGPDSPPIQWEALREATAAWDRASREQPAAPVFYCCGNQCPGLPWKASDHRHPSSCAGPGTKTADPLYDDPERTENPNPPSAAAPAQGGTIRDADLFRQLVFTARDDANAILRKLDAVLGVLDAERAERNP